MGRACVHAQLAQHLAAERALRQHTAHGEAHDAFRVTREQVLEALAADAAGVPAVPEVRLLQLLARIDRELGRVHDYNVVASVDVRRPDRLVLAAQQRRAFRREPTEDCAVGVDDVPLPGDVTGFGRERTHRKSFGEERTTQDSRPGRARSNLPVCQRRSPPTRSPTPTGPSSRRRSSFSPTPRSTPSSTWCARTVTASTRLARTTGARRSAGTVTVSRASRSKAPTRSPSSPPPSSPRSPTSGRTRIRIAETTPIRTRSSTSRSSSMRPARPTC